MAIISVLLSFLARKANDIVQAVFGWSITALFGRLPRRAQVMVTGALVLSLLWPLFVLGAFLPTVAAWAIAFVPFHAAIGDAALRAIFIALAVIAPLGIGVLVWAAAPKRTGGAVRAAVTGYATALAFFLAFFVTAVTVTIIKIVSLVRRWRDEHVYVQPHEHRYHEVVRALADACARAGYAPTVEEARPHKVFATTIMRTLARGAVAPFVSEKLERVTADGLELYLYPADLLLRGDPKKVARVRAMFSRTQLDRHAYIVGSPEAQKLQAELSRLEVMLDRDAFPGAVLANRLRQVNTQLMNIELPYDDWALLDAMTHRLELRLIATGRVAPTEDLAAPDYAAGTKVSTAISQ